MANSADLNQAVIKGEDSVTPQYHVSHHPSTDERPAASPTSSLSFSISRILGLKETPSTPPLFGVRPSSNDIPTNSLVSPTSSSNDGFGGEGLKANETEELSRKRRSRTTFRPDQLRQLECAFALSSYLSYAMEDELTRRLGLKNRQIRTWFQNRRGKQKKEQDELDVQFTNQLSWFAPCENHETLVENTSSRSVQSYQLTSQRHSPMMQSALSYPDNQRRHRLYKSCHVVCRSQSTPLRFRGFHRYQPYRYPAVYQETGN